MKVKAQNCTFIKKKKKNNFFFYFLEGFEIFFEKSEKNICLYPQSHSQILLKDYVFWHFSTHAGYPGRCGKMPNHSKIAPGGLGLCECDFFPQTRFLTN